jgi:hypothetical protein
MKFEIKISSFEDLDLNKVMVFTFLSNFVFILLSILLFNIESYVFPIWIALQYLVIESSRIRVKRFKR